MKYFVDSRDEKQYVRFKSGLSSIWKGADISQKRFLTYGALATMMWMAGACHLTPIQKARSLWPHAIMLVAGSGIVKTVKNGVGKAKCAKDGSLILLKKLGRCRTGTDMDNFTPTAENFIEYYQRYLGAERT